MMHPEVCMPLTTNRRHFIGAAGLALARPGFGQPPSALKPVRLGVVGTGGRGASLIQIAASMPGVGFPALCDINAQNLARAQDLVMSAGGPKPELYTGPEDYLKLVARDDLDAVLIATPWELHTPMAVASMKAGKYTAVEVPAALTIEQCWDLVNTHEHTGTPCMMLENWSFRRDNLAVLNMIRAGLLGQINHCHAAHSHDCTYWYFNPDGTPRWGGEYLLRRNSDPYPTHALGPVLSWMDLNCGDYPSYVTSMATRSLSLPHYFARKFGPDHPAARRKYVQGDIVTSLIKTIQGNTIVVFNDMQSPRPYDNRWEISGTDGLYNEQRNAVYIAGRSPQPDTWESFAPYQKQFDHPWYTDLERAEPGTLNTTLGHGGPDYLELRHFVNAVRTRTPTPLDIYDSVLMSSLIPLSGESIAQASAPVPFPDFTRGKWKTRKPYFGMPTPTGS
jgi:predicted dehydrogenase